MSAERSLQFIRCLLGRHDYWAPIWNAGYFCRACGRRMR